MSNVFLDDVVNDADLSEPYTIIRSNGGQFVEGGYRDNKTTIATGGVVSRDVSNELDMIPEGDRQKEMRAFWCTQPIYLTEKNGSSSRISDILVWQGEQYRVLYVANYSNRNYWKAIGARMAGS